MLLIVRISFLLNIVGVVVIKAELTEHFKEFLNNTYGEESRRFERADLGINASFGGRQDENDLIKKQVNYI